MRCEIYWFFYLRPAKPQFYRLADFTYQVDLEFYVEVLVLIQ